MEPLVARVLAPNPSPFTYTGTQSYLVGNSHAMVVIDPGPADPAHIDALLVAIGSARVVAIACTHTHADHSPAAAPLAQRTGAPIWGCAAIDTADTGPKLEAGYDHLYRADAVLADGQAIAGDGFVLRALATPGHTSNHLCYALETPDAAPALFTGDHVMGWSTTVISPPDGDMAAYMASLEALHSRCAAPPAGADRIYYPAHGEPITNPAQFVRGLIGHRRARENQILRVLGEGPASVPQLVARMYPGLTAGLLPAAGPSVLAHIITLQGQGKIEVAGETFALLPG